MQNPRKKIEPTGSRIPWDRPVPVTPANRLSIIETMFARVGRTKETTPPLPSAVQRVLLEALQQSPTLLSTQDLWNVLHERGLSTSNLTQTLNHLHTRFPEVQRIARGMYGYLPPAGAPTSEKRSRQ